MLRLATERCSLEIEKPLKDEDKGVWRIYFDDHNEIGCVFDLGNQTTKSNQHGKIGVKLNLKVVLINTNILDPINIEIWKKSSETIQITCEAPHELDYCYLETPLETEKDKEIQPIKFSNTKSLGICRFVVEPVSGTYSCGVNDINGGEDIQTYYKVQVYSAPAKAVAEQVEVKLGKPVSLLVKSIFKHPMLYCRFRRPSGEVHGMSKTFNMEGSYRFAGLGLTKGECGIEIIQISKSDLGVWTSTFFIEGKEYSVDILVTQSGKY